MIMNTSDILSELIGVGGDASSNLFTVNITSHNPQQSTTESTPKKNISYRISNFVVPQHTVSTVDLVHRGSAFKKLAPASPLERVLTIPLRIDSNYEEYIFLKECIASTSNGDFESPALENDPVNNVFTISVTAQSVENGSQLVDKAKWVFDECLLQDISSFTLDYGNSDPLYVNVTFIYDTLDFQQVKSSSGVTGEEELLGEES